MEAKNNAQVIKNSNEVNNNSNIEAMNQNGEKAATSNVTEIINGVNNALSNESTNDNTSMAEEKEVATQNADVNEANNASSVELSDTACCPKNQTKVTATINGVEQEITLAHTIYSMDALKKSQVKLLENVDKSKLLDEIFHLSTVEIFRKAGIALYDCEGEMIEEDAENVYVPVETSGTYWRFTFDDVLKHVQIHSFENVEEFAQVTGTTNLLSRGLSTKEKTGVAALASGDETYNTVYEMAVRTGMPGSSAEHYLGVQLKSTTTTLMSIGIKIKDVPMLGRTLEEALELHKQICLTFSPADAKKRYAIRAINSVISMNSYSLDTIMQALKTIPSEEITRARLMNCGTKEACISNVLVKFIIEMQHRKAA